MKKTIIATLILITSFSAYAWEPILIEQTQPLDNLQRILRENSDEIERNRLHREHMKKLDEINDSLQQNQRHQISQCPGVFCKY